MLFVLMSTVGVAFWGSVLYLALRFVRSAERRGIERGELEELRARVGRLEEELNVATTEVERLAAAERFTAQLLAGRPAQLPPAT